MKTEQDTPNERLRVQHLLEILPRNRKTVLEIGARNGKITRHLAERFEHVIALDLEKPKFDIPRVTNLQGDATKLQFGNEEFDCVVCTEVLEHIPALEQACKEIARVCKHDLIIGVPFEQDLRLGKTRCAKCGKRNPAYGHVNQFTKARLLALFPDFTPAKLDTVGIMNEKTNWFSALMADVAGNPWGTYEQLEGCMYCGAELERPTMNLFQRAVAFAGAKVSGIQRALSAPSPIWIHSVLSRGR
jgi:SAM-dependent methyltransferase